MKEVEVLVICLASHALIAQYWDGRKHPVVLALWEGANASSRNDILVAPIAPTYLVDR